LIDRITSIDPKTRVTITQWLLASRSVNRHTFHVFVAISYQTNYFMSHVSVSRRKNSGFGRLHSAR